jgi:hypothetical protein
MTLPRKRPKPKKLLGFAKPPRALNLRSMVKDLDRLAKEATMQRGGRRCERCGTADRLQWHHVYSRRIQSLRWDLDNLVILCAGHHLWWHHNPMDATQWFQEYAPPDRLERLRLKRMTARRTDLAGLRILLQNQVGER